MTHHVPRQAMIEPMTTHTLQGRYELRRLIARGGMAQVWEAYDAVLKRSVAVKTVDLAGSTDPTLGPRLQREAVALATLAHPDIVTVYDAGLEGDTAFFVMELIEGRDLAAVVRDGAIPVEEAARIGARVAGALAVAHEAGLVHRDIKPGNVLVHGKHVTVVDFGIAAVTHAAQTSMTTPGTVLGTATYMSPEQASGSGATPASDMYSFGCLLMALVTGEPPFSGQAPLELLTQHVSAQPARLTDRLPDVPARLDNLVHRLLDKDPSHRPTAREARQVLAELAGSADVGALPPRESPTQVLPVAAAVAGGAAAAAAAGVGAAGQGATGQKATGQGAATSVMPTLAPTLPATEVGAPVPSPARGRVPRSLPPRRPPLAPPSSGRRRRRPALLAAGVAVVLLAVVAFALASNPLDGGGETPPAAESAPAAEAGAQDAPVEAPVEPPAPAVQDFPALLSGLDVDEETRSDLLTTYDEAAASAAEGKTEKAVGKASELSRKLDELVDDEQLAPADRDALTATLVTTFGPLDERGGGKDDDD